MNVMNKTIRIFLTGWMAISSFACAAPSSATSSTEEQTTETTVASSSVPETAPSAADLSGPLPTIAPCELLSSSQVAAIIGEVKEGPTPGTALRGEARCGYVNMEGSWVTWSFYGAADRWEWEKNINNDKSPTSLAGLGDEAFIFRRGTDSVVLARKRGAVLEVNCSCGAANAETIARTAIEKL